MTLPDATIRIPPFRVVEFPETIAAAEGHFFSRFAATGIHRHNLPHWGQDDAVVFVTFRLVDSMPGVVLAQWRTERALWMERHPEPWSEHDRLEYMRAFPKRMEAHLDAGHGQCLLVRGECRAVIENALQHFNGLRYRIHAYVIMPNHVHVLLALRRKDDLVRTLHSWKSFTAKAINRMTGASGAVWQRDYFDRIVRSHTHYRHCVEYMRRNADHANGMIGRLNARLLAGGSRRDGGSP